MKIAISKHSGEKQIEGWSRFCKESGIEYTFVDPYSPDIVDVLKDYSAFLWYVKHTDYRDMLFAKQLMRALEASDIKLFPNSFTLWHYDDKLGQKYALEAIGAPHIPTHVFYTKDDALKWIKQTTFPIVMKLRGGAGGRNVILVKNMPQAKRLVRKAFGKGFSQISDKWQYFKEQIRLVRHHKRTLREGLMKGLGVFIVQSEYSRMHGPEKGYIMFQKFIPNNDSDWRVIVIGNRLYGMKRLVRKHDFRASGSGEFIYCAIPKEIMKIAFETSEKLNLQSVAFDFMYDDGKPVIIEMCFAFGITGSSKCTGYWDKTYQWHECTPEPYFWQIQDLLKP